MIKTDAAYKAAVRRLKDDREHLQSKGDALLTEGLNADQVAHVLEAETSFYLQLREEVEWYESVRRGDFQKATTLQDIGRLLIALRIATGLSQRELAVRLNVHESLISRDERNEYYGITMQRAQEIVDALNGKIEVIMRPPHGEHEFVAVG